jgi:protein-S-isoprenylcysteine O-methyltransferase Ste14
MDNNSISKKSHIYKFLGYVTITLSYLIGTISLLFFLLFLFHGSLNIVKLNLSESWKFFLNISLSIAFFIQHSFMIRKSFKDWLAKFLQVNYLGTLYTISSGVVLLTLIILWQKSAFKLIELQGIPRWLMRAVFLLSIFGFHYGVRAMGSFDAFGTKEVYNYLNDKGPPQPMPFLVRGPYRWVRHPLYSFCLLMIWACPDLSADRILFNGLWTLWIIVGATLEERDLVAFFGNEYRDYQSKVPMLIPRSIHPVQSATTPFAGGR